MIKDMKIKSKVIKYIYNFYNNLLYIIQNNYLNLI